MLKNVTWIDRFCNSNDRW